MIPRLLPWLIASSACFAVFWPGLVSWFQQDDFGWLGQYLEISAAEDLWKVLFAPKAQGTLRVFSERVYFLVFYWLFGLDPLPYHIWVFATQLVNIGLLAALLRRVFDSRVASGIGATLWAINGSLAIPLAWASAYNQILCAAFLFGALLLFVRYCQEGRRRDYWAQWVVFLLGFGANEMNVVSPALAAAYAVCYAPRRLASLVPMFAVSGAYTLLHTWVSPAQKTGQYALHLDGSMLSTFAHYWWTVGSGPDLANSGAAEWLAQLGLIQPWILTAAILVLAAARFCDRTIWFPLLWYGIAILPFLPLRDHLTFYYNIVPSVGIAMLGAKAMTSTRDATPMRVVVILVVFIYAVPTAKRGGAVGRFFQGRAEEVRTLVLGVERAHELHPRKTILLTGVSSSLFWAGINDRPFRLLGINDVFLVPGAEARIEDRYGEGTVNDFVMPEAQARRLLEEHRAVVYDAAGPQLRNVTTLFEQVVSRTWHQGLSRRVDPGSSVFSGQLGEGWNPIEGHFRWMGKRAVVYLGAPESERQRLYLMAYCPAILVRPGPLRLTVTIDGHGNEPVVITKPDAAVEATFDLPPGSVGRERLVVVLEVDRSIQEQGPDGRTLGLAFGGLSIR